MSQAHTHNRVRRLAFGVMTMLLLVMPVAVAADTGTPQQVAVGASATFSGTGFTPNEILSFWETAPGGATTSLPGTQVDGNGAFSINVSFPNAGQWEVTSHGLTSGKQTVGVYAVGTGAGTTTAPVTAPPAAAPGSGTSVAAGSVANFTGTGFSANEAISIWETGPDTTVTPLPSIQSDANGAFSTSVTFPSVGQWQVTAQGVISGQKTVGVFAVGGATGAAPGATSVAAGASVTFSGTGFYASEQISLWETAPGGAVTPLSGIVADGSGAFSTSVSFSSNGQWEVTARGVTSGKQSVGTYNVGATAGAATATTGTAATSSTGAATSSLVPNAPQTTIGSAVIFTGTGFTAGESIAMWETAPDSSVTPLANTLADTTGGFSTPITFPSTGYWQVTAQGRTSGRSVISGFNVTNGSSTTASTSAAPSSPGNAVSAGAPISVNSGTLVKFIVPGFTANEEINAWTTAPNGVVTPFDSAQATPTGLVAVSTTFSSTGLWQITVRGKESGHAVYGQYQVK